MRIKIKSIIKIISPIFIASTIFFGISTLSTNKSQLHSIKNYNLLNYKKNLYNSSNLNSLKLEGKIIQTSFSQKTSSALVEDNMGKTHLYMWGDNDHGQQGNGKSGGIINKPTELKGFLKNGEQITNISISNNTSSALVQDNRKTMTHLYMWGNNDNGQQGNGVAQGDVTTPKEVTKLNEFLLHGEKIIQTSISFYTSSVLVQETNGDTHLYMWGGNDYGQQGDGTRTESVTKPKKVNIKDAKKIIQISMSSDTSSALVKDASGKTHIYMWGTNRHGQQGTGKLNMSQREPLEVKNINNFLQNGSEITQISMSQETSSAIIKSPVANNKSNTKLYMWGNNNYGQQGNGKVSKPNEYVKTPTEVTKISDLLKGEKIINQISISANTSSVILKDKGESGFTHLYIWGENSFGQQGNGSSGNPSPLPKELKIEGGQTLTKLLLSDWTSTVLTEDNNGSTNLYMWGANKKGQQGDETTSDVYTPKKSLSAEIPKPSINYTHYKKEEFVDHITYTFNLDMKGSQIIYDNKTKVIDPDKKIGNETYSLINGNENAQGLKITISNIDISIPKSEDRIYNGKDNKFKLQLTYKDFFKKEHKDIISNKFDPFIIHKDIKINISKDGPVKMKKTGFIYNFEMKQTLGNYNWISKGAEGTGLTFKITPNSKLAKKGATIKLEKRGENLFSLIISNIPEAKEKYNLDESISIQGEYKDLKHKFPASNWTSENNVKLGVVNFTPFVKPDVPNNSGLSTKKIILIITCLLIINFIFLLLLLFLMARKDEKEFAKYESEKMGINLDEYKSSKVVQERNKKEKRQAIKEWKKQIKQNNKL